jgi:hypothetical protein
MGAFYTSPDNTVLKHGFWLVRRLVQEPSIHPTKAIPRFLGIQHVSGCYSQSAFLLQPRSPLQSSALHLRCRRLLIVRWSHSNVRTRFTFKKQVISDATAPETTNTSAGVDHSSLA